MGHAQVRGTGGGLHRARQPTLRGAGQPRGANIPGELPMQDALHGAVFSAHPRSQAQAVAVVRAAAACGGHGARLRPLGQRPQEEAERRGGRVLYGWHPLSARGGASLIVVVGVL